MVFQVSTPDRHPSWEEFGALLDAWLKRGQAGGAQRHQGPWEIAEFSQRIGAESQKVRRWLSGQEPPKSKFILRMSPVLFGNPYGDSEDWKVFLATWHRTESASSDGNHEPRGTVHQ
jgi:hypothetical protein